MAELVVEATGPLALIEDLGRPGYGALGVPTGGAADRRALRLANRLVGNPEPTPGIEALFGGLALRAVGDVLVALTGAPAAATIDGRAVPVARALVVPDGAVLRLGAPEHGTRCYVAIRGGLAVPATLGSAASDPTSGLGPAKLARGDTLAIGGADVAAIPGGDLAEAQSGGGPVLLRAVPGPRDDWFGAAGLAALASRAWRVGEASDRVGVRLDGEPIARVRDGELASEGVVRGSIQVPRDGLPLIFLTDHPTTGGYPVIAVVIDADTDLLAQARPGDEVRVSLLPRPELPR